jgi:hypothetical protein
MNTHEWADRDRLASEHSKAAREALARYASAKELENRLERARDTIFRQLAAARSETFAAWRTLNAALDEPAESEEEGEP